MAYGPSEQLSNTSLSHLSLWRHVWARGQLTLRALARSPPDRATGINKAVSRSISEDFLTYTFTFTFTLPALVPQRIVTLPRARPHTAFLNESEITERTVWTLWAREVASAHHHFKIQVTDLARTVHLA